MGRSRTNKELRKVAKKKISEELHKVYIAYWNSLCQLPFRLRMKAAWYLLRGKKK